MDDSSKTSGLLPIDTSGTAAAYPVAQAVGSQQPTLLPQPLPPQQNFIHNLYMQQPPQYVNQYPHPQLVGVPTNQYADQPVGPYMMPMYQFQPQQGVVGSIMTYPPHIPYYSPFPLHPTFFPPVFAHVQDSQISNAVPTSQNPQGNNNAALAPPFPVHPTFFPPVSNQQYKGESHSADKSRRLVFIDESGALHAVDREKKAYLWTTKTKVPAFSLHKDANVNLDTHGFNFDPTARSLTTVDGIPDEKYLIYYNMKDIGGRKIREKMPIEVDTLESLREKVGALYTSNEYEVTGNTDIFWINPDSGTICKFKQNEDDFIYVKRSNYSVLDKKNDVDLKFSTFDVAEKDRGRISFIHVRDSMRLFNALSSNFGIQKESIPSEGKLTVRYDRRITREDGTEIYEGILTDPLDHEFVPKSVIVQEIKKDDARRIQELYAHLGSHPNIVDFRGIEKYQSKTYAIFEMFRTMENDDQEPDKTELDKTLRGIVSGAFHFWGKEKIHGKLEHGNLVSVDGTVKLFLTEGYKRTLKWTLPNEKKEFSELANLLSTYISKKRKNSKTSFQDENPVAHDLIQKLTMDSMTSEKLMCHVYLWKPEKFMEFFYNVSNCIEARDTDTGGITGGFILEQEFCLPVNKDRVYKNRKGSFHMRYLERMELRGKYWKKFGKKSLCGLLRLARNTHGHENELTEEITKLWGNEGLGNYWCGLHGIFPYLPVVIFDLVDQKCPETSFLKKYTRYEG